MIPCTVNNHSFFEWQEPGRDFPRQQDLHQVWHCPRNTISPIQLNPQKRPEILSAKSSDHLKLQRPNLKPGTHDCTTIFTWGYQLINNQGKYCMRIVIGVLVIQSGVEAAEDFASVLTLDILSTLYFHSHLKTNNHLYNVYGDIFI